MTRSIGIAVPLLALALLAVLASGGVQRASAAAPCLFAPLFDADELFRSAELQEEFITLMMQREGRFLQPNPCNSAPPPSPGSTDPDLSSIGYHAATGMTLDGHRWTMAGGLPLGEPHLFTAASKESLHLAMLALALSGNAHAALFLSPDNPANATALALDVLTTKVNTLDSFFATFPGFGGFLPWVYVSPAGLTPTADFNSSVPSLDNGQMFWGAYAVAHVLATNHSTALHRALHLNEKQVKGASAKEQALYSSPDTTLAARWTNVWQRMVSNALIVFLDVTRNTTLGQFRTVSVVRDRTRPIDPTADPAEEAQWYSGVPGSNQPHLNDPYEGELFTNMAYLLSDWSWTGAASPAVVWPPKRDMLQRADLLVPDASAPGGFSNITVERGYWHSGHEKWKYFLQPYSTASSWSHRILMAGEKARTWFSYVSGLPGGFASAAGTAESDQQDTGYLSDCGIQQIAFEEVSNRDVITPYAWAALSMASRAHGMAWFHNHLLADRAQTCWGSLESLNRTGSNVAPLGTWDTKITTMVAWLGGIGDLVADSLQQLPVDMTNGVHARDAEVLGVAQPPAGQITNALQLWGWALDTEWSRVFDGHMQGEHLPFQRPQVRVPRKLGPWPSCTDKSAECDCKAGKKADEAAAAEARVKADASKPQRSHDAIALF